MVTWSTSICPPKKKPKLELPSLYPARVALAVFTCPSSRVQLDNLPLVTATLNLP